ncbi:ankyrin repeat domain-containing protein [Streptomyces sp. NBC_01725]|uniref:ankyrin repeat domain-containing protein n=1 Tax=Streptomyces sp. NBC_01725 TaxID=2975923 RepID=UPI002E2819E8|nr:ankyrin repeat domain-containing protein [Streptomyces sp. NBC_01725]
MTNERTAGSDRARDELFSAVYEGRDDTVVALLRSGVPAEATDRDGQSALYAAAVSDEPGAVRVLLAAGADPERVSGADGGDLPLCGAACGGHTEVVVALLAAGARPDRREAYGFTALAWAVGQGHADTVEALLAHGADPDLPGPGGGARDGEPPLVTAARRGSPSTVRALLRHGAGAREEALAEARRWTAPEAVEHELHAELLPVAGGGGGGGDETVVRRIEEDGGVTIVVETLKDGVPVASLERQTGHGAITTVLEESLGIRTPFEELAGRALRCGVPGRDDWREQVAALWRRGDEESFEAALAWCASDDPLRRAFAADVLGGLGELGGDRRTFADRALSPLRELCAGAGTPELIGAGVTALGKQGAAEGLPEILRHAGHPDAAVRRRVAVALTGLVPGDHEEGVAALTALSADIDGSVRERATAALAGVDADTPAIRAALAARLTDPVAVTAAEAARGLVVRRDPAAVDALARMLADGSVAGQARETAADAVGRLSDTAVRRRLAGLLPRGR